MRRDSWYSVRMTCRPPAARTAGMQLDVGAAAGHVGCDRDPARLASTRDDLGLLRSCRALRTTGSSPARLSNCDDMLGRFDRTGADQHGAARARRGVRRFNDGVPFALGRRQHARAGICPPQRPVRGNAHDPQAVDAAQFARRLDRRSGHAAEMQVATEEALVGDLRQRLAPLGDGAMLPWPRSAGECRFPTSGRA